MIGWEVWPIRFCGNSDSLLVMMIIACKNIIFYSMGSDKLATDDLKSSFHAEQTISQNMQKSLLYI